MTPNNQANKLAFPNYTNNKLQAKNRQASTRMQASTYVSWLLLLLLVLGCRL